MPRGSRRLSTSPAACALFAGAVSAESWTLQQIVDTALAQNPGLKAIEERRGEVAGGVQEAKADAFPQVAFDSSWSRSRNPSLLNSPDFEDIIGSIPDFRFTPRVQELWGLGFDVSQPLYTSGKVGAAIDLARLVEDATEAQIAAARLDTAAAAAEAFFLLFEAREGLETVEIQRQARMESQAVVEARYELGEATRLELLQSRASVAQLEPLLDAARGLAEVAEIRLVAVLGLRQRPTFELEAGTRSRPRLRASARVRRPGLAGAGAGEAGPGDPSGRPAPARSQRGLRSHRAAAGEPDGSPVPGLVRRCGDALGAVRRRAPTGTGRPAREPAATFM